MRFPPYGNGTRTLDQAKAGKHRNVEMQLHIRIVAILSVTRGSLSRMDKLSLLSVSLIFKVSKLLFKKHIYIKNMQYSSSWICYFD